MFRTAPVLCALSPLLIAPACSSDGGTDAGSGPEQGELRIELQTDRRVTETIGPEGGVVEAVAEDGTRYRLTIPPTALLGTEQITLTPIDSIENAPTGGESLFGVEMTPDGLGFYRGVTLQMAPADGDERLSEFFGFGYSGAGEDFHGEPWLIDGPWLSLPIAHFSGAGGGYRPLPRDPVDFDDPSVQLRDDLFRLAQPYYPNIPVEDPEFRQQVSDLLDGYYDDHLLPDAQAAAADPANPTPVLDTLRDAVELDALRAALSTEDTASRLGDRTDPAWRTLLEALEAGVRFFNEECKRRGDVTQFQRALSLNQVLCAFATTDDECLSDDLFSGSSCLTVDMDLTFKPETLQVGESGTVSVLVGWQLGDGPVSYDEEIEVTPSINQYGRLTPPGPQDVDPVFKSYDVQVTATGENGQDGEITLNLVGCAKNTGVCSELELNIDALPGGEIGATVVFVPDTRADLELYCGSERLGFMAPCRICYSGLPSGAVGANNVPAAADDCGSLPFEFRISPAACSSSGGVAAGEYSIGVRADSVPAGDFAPTQGACMLAVPDACVAPTMSCMSQSTVFDFLSGLD